MLHERRANLARDSHSASRPNLIFVLLTHRHYLFLRQELHALPEREPRPAGLTFEQARPEIADELRDYEDEVFTREDVRRKLTLGDQLFVIRGEGEVAWFGWARVGRFLHTPLDLWCDIEPDCVDIFGIYTKPHWRGQGLAKWGYSRMLSILRQQGFRRAFVQVETWNIPSRRSIQACEFLPYLRLRVWRAGRRKLLALRTLGPQGDGETRQFSLRTSAQFDARINRLLYPPD